MLNRLQNATLEENHTHLIEPAGNALQEGGILLYPTDTIWGLGCDASNPEAVEKIYELKKRERNKPLIVLVDGLEMLKNHVSEIHPRLHTLLELHEKPLTVIYKKAIGLASNVVAADGSIGIRIVKDPFCQDLIRSFGKPIVSTSANVSGAPFPKHFGEVRSDIIMGVDHIVKHKQFDKSENLPSVIVKVIDDKGNLEFLRT